MQEDTEAIRVPGRLLPDTPPPTVPAACKPNNALLVIGTALVAGAAVAVLTWVGDPNMTHAQSALIVAVVLIVAAGTSLICHGVRVWIHAAETRIAHMIEESAKKLRCQHYDLASDVAATNGEMEALKALLGDFIKRYPPVLDHHGVVDEDALRELRAHVETLAEMVSDPQRVVLDMPNGDVYELGKRVGRDEVLRERGGDQTR